MLFKMMVGGPKPFPAAWGAARGWPRNFRPYNCRFAEDNGEGLKLVAAKSEKETTVVLVRHAHSSAQAAITLRKKTANVRPER